MLLIGLGSGLFLPGSGLVLPFGMRHKGHLALLESLVCWVNHLVMHLV